MSLSILLRASDININRWNGNCITVGIRIDIRGNEHHAEIFLLR